MEDLNTPGFSQGAAIGDLCLARGGGGWFTSLIHFLASYKMQTQWPTPSWKWPCLWAPQNYQLSSTRYPPPCFPAVAGGQCPASAATDPNNSLGSHKLKGTQNEAT